MESAVLAGQEVPAIEVDMVELVDQQEAMVLTVQADEMEVTVELVQMVHQEQLDIIQWDLVPVIEVFHMLIRTNSLRWWHINYKNI